MCGSILLNVGGWVCTTTSLVLVHNINIMICRHLSAVGSTAIDTFCVTFNSYANFTYHYVPSILSLHLYTQYCIY